MSTLAEIETAAEKLSPVEQQRLLLFLASQLRSQAGAAPEPRQFTREQVAAWIAEDELERQEQAADRKAIVEARGDLRPPVQWTEAKKHLGLV